MNKISGLHSLYTNLEALILERYKMGLLKLVLSWCFYLCSNFVKYHHKGDI